MILLIKHMINIKHSLFQDFTVPNGGGSRTRRRRTTVPWNSLKWPSRGTSPPTRCLSVSPDSRESPARWVELHADDATTCPCE